jgi:hypothetical protein
MASVKYICLQSSFLEKQNQIIMKDALYTSKWHHKREKKCYSSFNKRYDSCILCSSDNILS